jgi:hypothetical protein
MYSGPQQGQFWQQVFLNFFFKGQCSWIYCFKHFSFLHSSSVYFPGVQLHFLVLGAQPAHAHCGAGKTRGAVDPVQSKDGENRGAGSWAEGSDLAVLA